MKRTEKAQAWREMGMLENGQFISGFEEKRGLGAGSEDDIYDTYRKKSSQQYRVAAGKRGRASDVRGMICYVCKNYGHLARNCPTQQNPIN